jgi:hypothetical protein
MSSNPERGGPDPMLWDFLIRQKSARNVCKFEDSTPIDTNAKDNGNFVQKYPCIEAFQKNPQMTK